MSITPPIPIIDLSGMGEAQTDARIIDALAAAYGGLGFGYVINHGIAQTLIDDVFAASARLHAAPTAIKDAIAVNQAHRGYIPLNSSTDVTSDLAEVTKPNQSESFMMMREDAVADPDIYLSGPNQWPQETIGLTPFRDPVTAYHDAMCGLGQRLIPLMIRAAGIDPATIMDAFITPTTWLRLLHYPPAPENRPTDLYGSAPHRDFGAITLLAQDDVGGLQVMTPDGAWVDVPRLPGSFVVNVGDMLHRLSNGRLISTPHRVINRSGRERYSCPFFFDPHVHTMITPLAGTGTPLFEPIRFDAFLRSELEASYDAHKVDANG